METLPATESLDSSVLIVMDRKQNFTIGRLYSERQFLQLRRELIRHHLDDTP